jgi:hypothetical protein
VSRVAPLAPPWSEEDAAGINSWGHPDRTYEPLLLVRCLHRHPALATRLRKLGESLYVAALLPPRTRTIAILRICALVGCEYEWGAHARRLRQVIPRAKLGFDEFRCVDEPIPHPRKARPLVGAGLFVGDF